MCAYMRCCLYRVLATAHQLSYATIDAVTGRLSLHPYNRNRDMRAWIQPDMHVCMRVFMHACTHMPFPPHTHAHAHPHAYAHMHAPIHEFIHSFRTPMCTHVRAHTRGCARARTCVCVCVHMCVCARVFTCGARVGACMCVRMCVCVRVHARACVVDRLWFHGNRVCTHARTQACTCTRTGVCIRSRMQLCVCVCAQLCACAHTHPCTCACVCGVNPHIDARTRARVWGSLGGHTLVFAHACVRTCELAWVCVWVRACTHPRSSVCAHARAHARAHTPVCV